MYALAAISFEALSGKRPREGKTPMEIAHKIATEGAPDLLDAWPTAPKEAARVLQRGMALEPEDRPASAGEFARELTRALEDAPEETPRHAASSDADRRPPRRPRQRGPAAAAAAAAAAAPRSASRTPRRRPGTRRPPRPAPSAAASSARRRQHEPRPAAARRPRAGAIALAAIFIALALATIAGAVLSGGDDGGSSPSSADNTPAKPKADANKKKKEPKAKKEPKEEPRRRARSRRRGAERLRLVRRGARRRAERPGLQLMNSGDYEGAIPVLQEAVDSFPPGTGNINYAYALFNLGKSLRLAGRPDEAIPILEQRLKIENQTEAVQAELDQAKRDAGKS